MEVHDFTFVFDDREYRARFEKIHATPVQFKVIDVAPSDYSRTLNLLFFADTASQILTWEDLNPVVSDKERSFKTAIANAIFNTCAREGIAVFE